MFYGLLVTESFEQESAIVLFDRVAGSHLWLFKFRLIKIEKI